MRLLCMTPSKRQFYIDLYSIPVVGNKIVDSAELWYEVTDLSIGVYGVVVFVNPVPAPGAY